MISADVKHSIFFDLLETSLLGKRGRTRRYAIPSAGKLYPYYMKIRQFRGDRASVTSSVSITTIVSFLERIRYTEYTDLEVSVIYRPRVSMKKYGERGYIYGLQDCGHLISNIEIAALARAISCAVTYYPSDSKINSTISSPTETDVFEICRLKMSVTGKTDRGNSFDGLVRYQFERKSATSFTSTPLNRTAVKSVLDYAFYLNRYLAPTTLTGTLKVDAVLRDENWRTLGYSQKQRDWSYARDITQEVSLETLFMRQQFVSNAQVVLAISDVEPDHVSSIDTNILVGRLGQCLYISAAKHNIGICCVGGFDYRNASIFIGSEAGGSPSYLMVLGNTAAEAVPKEDRVFDVKHREIALS